MAVNRSFSARAAPAQIKLDCRRKGRISASVYGAQQLKEEEY